MDLCGIYERRQWRLHARWRELDHERLTITARQQVVPQERFYAIAARNALGFPSLSGCKSVPRMESNLELPEIKGKAMSGLNPAR